MTSFTNTVSFDTGPSHRLMDLALRTQTGAIGQDKVLEGLVFHALHGHEGDWSDNFDDGHGNDVWHRRDAEDGWAFDTAPQYTTTYEGALEALPEGVWISQLHQTGPGQSWVCVLLGADVPKEESTGHGADLPRAILNAALLVRART